MDRISNLEQKSTFNRSNLSHVKAVLQHELKPIMEYSKLDVKLKSENGSWQLVVVMKFPKGFLGVKREGVDLNKILYSAVAELRLKYKVMELNSENEHFQFDKMEELNFYNQMCSSDSRLIRQSLKTMILEDDLASEKVLEHALQKAGCGVDCFLFPEQALGALQYKNYDLLILDWNLPFMNGEVFLQEADKIQSLKEKNDKSYKVIPTIICTASKQSDISIPRVKYFAVFDYWDKSLPFSSVVSSIELVTQKITNF